LIYQRKYKYNNSFNKIIGKKNVYFLRKMMIFGFFTLKIPVNREFFLIFVRLLMKTLD